MVNGPVPADDPPMTTEQPTAPRTLRRRSDDRVIGGVASGLGDYFNVDPLLIRIGFVGLMVFGGMGIFLYVAAWLLLPDETTDKSIAERILGRAGLGGSVLAAFLIVIGALVLVNVLGEVAERSGGVPAVGFALVVIVAGALILRRGEPEAATPADPASADVATAAVSPARVVVRRPPRPRSPLGWYVLGGMLIAVGLLALVTNLSGAEVDPGQYFGVAIGVLGIGLLIGAWWGHARVLILLGILLLPFAFAASLIDVPIEGGWGAHRFSPTTRAELRDEYRLAGGEIFLDLTNLDAGSEPVVITASVAMGQVYVLLPDDADVEVDAAVGGGRTRILGAYQNGTQLVERAVVDGDGTRFVLDLGAGMGDVTVETAQSEDR
jgi:phage shock protein PspC (stress-responsive transcriptional regulator)